MKLETAIELIKEAQKIEENIKKVRNNPLYECDYRKDELSKEIHDKCLQIARKILIDNYYERH